MIQVYDGDGVEPGPDGKIRGWRIAGVTNENVLFHATMLAPGFFKLGIGHGAGFVWSIRDDADAARSVVRQQFPDIIGRLWLEPVRG